MKESGEPAARAKGEPRPWLAPRARPPLTKMSTLYLGSELQSLAEKLAEELAAHERDGDFFAPVTIVVPNRSQRQWLRLWLARRTGVCINLRFRYLEEALWELLRDADPRAHQATPEPLDDQAYRLMVLAVLVEDRDPGLAVLQEYAGIGVLPLSRRACRRAWHLADQLWQLIRDYEYDRQDTLIQPWLQGKPGLRTKDTFHRAMEEAQRTLFARITAPETGRRALLAAGTGRNVKTFPQYAMEVMEQKNPKQADCAGPIHFFGLTHINALHTRVIGWLGAGLDIRLYHLNVLAGGHEMATPGAQADFIRELRSAWGKPAVEALGLVRSLADKRKFREDTLPTEAARDSRRATTPTVLSRLHDHLLGRQTAADDRLAQDTSLQIVACPGAVREVETVHNCILHNLQTNPALRLTDIAVLVTDVDRYRPIVQAVFERPPAPLKYSLVDLAAAGQSLFGQALLGMLDLALETFTRSRVFEVLLNPCFLARLDVDRAQALIWLEWAETLGVCQGWDAAEKASQGYPASPLYAWHLALQRLRLGRYMEVAAEEGDEPAPRFEKIIPFADIHCSDREHLDTFCAAVESLLPRLARLRGRSARGAEWAGTLRLLVSDFLEVPEDRPEEEQVRRTILGGLDELAVWDHLRPAGADAAGLPLALVREFVLKQLEGLAGQRGEYLAHGVTVAALQSMRPIPFSVVYILGLDAELFPGSNTRSSLDLRNIQTAPGDVGPAEEKTYAFLENLIAAKDKLYLVYNNYDLSKDRPLLPAMPLTQLTDYLSNHVTREPFQPITIPRGNDAAWLFDSAQQKPYQDVLVQYRQADRFVAFSVAQREGQVSLDQNQQDELQKKRATLRVDFAMAAPAKTASPLPLTISIRELRRFLEDPAYASLRRHLRIDDEEETAREAEEPLITPDLHARNLERQVLHQLVRRAGEGDLQQALDTWTERFRDTFRDSQLRCRVPEDAFGEMDAQALEADLRARIDGPGGIAAFLRTKAGLLWCGPALVGASYTPLGARTRFPALRLRPGQELPQDAGAEIRLVGSTPLAWCGRDCFEILAITTSKDIEPTVLCKPMLEPLLFYLAMRANPEPNGKGIAAREWLSRRHFHLHVAYPGGIQTWSYPIDRVSAEEAMRYLAQLTLDLLDPGQLDFLPLWLVNGSKETRIAFDEGFKAKITPAEYKQRLEETCERMLENDYTNKHQSPQIVEMSGAEIPDDALAKVRRRFGLLDRGPALVRQGGFKKPARRKR